MTELEVTELDLCQQRHSKETAMLARKGIDSVAFEVLPWGLYWYRANDDLSPHSEFREGHIEGHSIFEWRQKEVEPI